MCPECCASQHSQSVHVLYVTCCDREHGSGEYPSVVMGMFTWMIYSGVVLWWTPPLRKYRE